MPTVVWSVVHPSAALRGCHIGIRHEVGSIFMRIVAVAVVVRRVAEDVNVDAIWVCLRTRQGHNCEKRLREKFGSLVGWVRLVQGEWKT